VRTPADVRVVHAADVVNDGTTVPVFAWIVDGPDGAVVVDTGMLDSTPELDAEWAPTIHEWPEIDRVACVVNTHLHFDHCGGNRLYAGTPIYVQRAELEAVRAPDYLEDWVHFDGATYVQLEGDADVLPGISVLFTPGHSPGHQAVVVDTTEGPVVLAGDVTYFMRELIAGATPSIRRIHELRPRRVYLAHASRPWEPNYPRAVDAGASTAPSGEPPRFPRSPPRGVTASRPQG
jgi:N-acyl homoserine lactone hydrolase